MSIWCRIHPREKLENLTVWDIISVTVILFGYFVYTSTDYFISTLTATNSYVSGVAEATEFTSADDWANLKIQGVFLFLALLYLWIRNFDFKRLKIQFRWSVFLWVPIIYLLVGFVSDVIATVFGEYNYFAPNVLANIDWTFKTVIDKFMNLYPSIIIYGLFNGFYEEFYFLGLLTCVKEKSKWLVFAFSLLVRTSFHTYQGLLSALTIGLIIGTIYYFLYTYKVKNLLPFFLAHALADFFGASAIYMIVMWS